MELSRLAMIVFFLAGVASATPAGPVIIRLFPSVRVCKDVNFGPPCDTVPSNFNDCGKCLFNTHRAIAVNHQTI
ncbi:hypothetical protein J3F84DRAFT_384190, partial [Trichoderma pleuroticola]